VSEKGSIAPLIASYLAILLLASLGVSIVATAMLAGNRVQGVADYAVLYGHDRSIRAGIPQEQKLKAEVASFVSNAESAQRLEIVRLESVVEGAVSKVRLCARFRDSFGLGFDSMVICREASAKSFLIP
jgi:hypothetical protein